MKNPSGADDLARLAITSAGELRAWLEAHHASEESVWLVTWKASVRDRYVSRDEVLDELMAFGWIDGVRRKLDDSRTMQLISKRRVQHWARSYKERAARLIAEGRMAEPGFASIDAGKASGLWDFMDDVDDLIIPGDLASLFSANPAARVRFEAFPPSARRFTLRWIKLARTDGTRRKRLETTVASAARGEFVPGVRMVGKE
jgi:uncharacterized protein YdeI (YjbR/CyaY-like superfamily)